MAYREEYAGGSRVEEPAAELDRREAPEPKALAREEARVEKPSYVAAEAPEAKGTKGARSKRRRWAVLGVLLAGAAAFGGYEGYGWWTQGRFMVSTDDAYVQAEITILAAKVSGYVAEVDVVNNQSVKAGDVIARIDDGDYRLALESARDKLATQASTITRIGRQVEAAKAAVAQAAAQVDAAKADAQRAASDYARQMQLAQSDYTSRARLEQAKADRDRAEAAVKSAEAALAAANANIEVLTAQQGEAEHVRAELATAANKAERDLSFTVIRAPVDGVVGNKAVQVGTFVQPGARLAAIVPLNTVHIDANFKETQLARLKPGQKVDIEVDAYPGRDFVGTVESVSPASGSVFSLLPPENATGNFTKIVQRVPVRVAVSPEVADKGLLRPGLSVWVSVDTRTAPASGPTPAPAKTALRK